MYCLIIQGFGSRSTMTNRPPVGQGKRCLQADSGRLCHRRQGNTDHSIVKEQVAVVECTKPLLLTSLMQKLTAQILIVSLLLTSQAKQVQKAPPSAATYRGHRSQCYGSQTVSAVQPVLSPDKRESVASRVSNPTPVNYNPLTNRQRNAEETALTNLIEGSRDESRRVFSYKKNEEK